MHFFLLNKQKNGKIKIRIKWRKGEFYVKQDAFTLLKHSETEGHLKRVQMYTKELLDFHNKRLNLNLSKEEKADIVHGSVMHDLGKAGVSERILCKKGPLEEHERTIIETHPLIGAYMLDKMIDATSYENKNRYTITKNIIKYHHERWDGTGYPEKLKEHEIPFEARLISVVDTYDALTSKRCYKEPWTVEEAIHFIKEKKAIFFEPTIVESFLLLKNKWKKMTEFAPI